MLHWLHHHPRRIDRQTDGQTDGRKCYDRHTYQLSTFSLTWKSGRAYRLPTERSSRSSNAGALTSPAVWRNGVLALLLERSFVVNVGYWQSPLNCWTPRQPVLFSQLPTSAADVHRYCHVQVGTPGVLSVVYQKSYLMQSVGQLLCPLFNILSAHAHVHLLHAIGLLVTAFTEGQTSVHFISTHQKVFV